MQGWQRDQILLVHEVAMRRANPGNIPERASPAFTTQDFYETYASPSFVRLIRGSCLRFRGKSVEQSDLHQAAAIALWKSMGSYDPSLGTPLEHYASRAIRRAVADEAARESRHWKGRVESEHTDDLEIEPCEKSGHDFDNCAEFVSDTVFDGVLLQQVDQWTATLPESLRRVYKLRHVHGLSQTEAAREMGVTQQRVSCLERKLAQLARAEIPANQLQ
jgi:RNA polymerase sigma factor (sigma-70 family)